MKRERLVSVLRYVGRMILFKDDYRKNLYIKRFSDDEVKKRKTDIENQRDAYGSYEMAYNDREQPKRCF